jgi:hypothetical protein
VLFWKRADLPFAAAVGLVVLVVLAFTVDVIDDTS